MSGGPEVLWTFHGTAAVENYKEAVAWLGKFCGCRVLEYGEAHDPLIGRNGGVTWIADNGLELMEPNRPDGGPGRFIARFGPGLYGLGFQIANTDDAAAWFEAHDAAVIGDPANGFFFTHPKATCGVHLEWSQLENEEWDPRFGAAVPSGPEPLIDVVRIAHWGALVDDPSEALKRFQELWQVPVMFQDSNAPLDAPSVGISIVDGAFTLYRLPPNEAEMARLWGKAALRPHLHLMSLRVRDLGQAAEIFSREGIGILRGSAADGEIVTDPADSLGLLISWTDRDLPNDPRGPFGDDR